MLQQSSTVIYYTSRAVITDRNGVFLTDTEGSVLGVIDSLLYEGGAEIEEKYLPYLNGSIENKRAAVLPLIKKTEASGLWCFDTLTRYEKNQLAVHLIGSLNGNGDGESGLEYAYNGFLRKNEKKYSVSYLSDSAGGIISGLGVNISGDARPSEDRLVLTLDAEIQRIVKAAAENIESGAVVVARADTGEIVSLLSLPEYHPYDMGDALETEGAFINKALSPFNAGSAFKLVTLACFLENGGTEFYHSCNGEVSVGNSVIGCYLRRSHGELDINTALSASCNGFFIKMGLHNGAEKMLDTARAFGFGSESELASGYYSKGGTLASEKELSFPAELANMSMGQGKLLVTPIQMTQLTQTIANGGVLSPLYTVKGTVENGVFNADPLSEREGERIISEATAKRLTEAMAEVSKSGTGKKANPSCGSATKTSTAETGILNAEGKYTVQSWITGFFPAESPRYVITVLAEDVDPKETVVSPVFKEIAEGIMRLENFS